MTTLLNGQNLSPEEEIKNLRIQLKAHNDEIHHLRKILLKSQEDARVISSGYLLLQKKYDEALEELIYREEYFKLYELRILKLCVKIVMNFKKLKGRVKKLCTQSKAR